MGEKILVKIGSSVIYDNKKNIFLKTIFNNLIKDISNLEKSQKYNFVVCMSGAVSLGRDYLNSRKIKLDDNPSKGFFATIGQPIIINKIQKILEKNDQQVAQKLISTENNTKGKIKSLTKLTEIDGIIPFINGNDIEMEEEGKFSDNDNLSKYLAEILKPDYVFFLSSTDGVYLDRKNRKIESEITNKNISSLNFFTKTENGTGGMESKIKNAKDLNKFCKNVYIANGRTKNIISRILNGEKLGTRINFHD